MRESLFVLCKCVVLCPAGWRPRPPCEDCGAGVATRPSAPRDPVGRDLGQSRHSKVLEKYESGQSGSRQAGMGRGLESNEAKQASKEIG